MQVPDKGVRTAIIVLALIITLPFAASATQITKQLAPGVTLLQDINTSSGAQLVINAVTVDPKAPGVSFKAGIGSDVLYVHNSWKGREAISETTRRNGALVGINADFCSFTGDPASLCIINGELVSQPIQNRVAVVFYKDGTAAFDNPTYKAELTLADGATHPVHCIDYLTPPNDRLTFFADIFGASTRTTTAGTEVVCSSDNLPVRSGKTVNLTVTEVRPNTKNTPIPKGGVVLTGSGTEATFLKDNVKVGDKLTVRFDIVSTNGVDYTRVEQAVSGKPWILKDGKRFIDSGNEGVPASFVNYRNPRTAVGITADGKVILVTVDGRQSISRGVSLQSLSDIMKRLGAVNAVNLDGGGSTTMSYRGMVINSPSGGSQRPVPNALLVFANPTATEQLPNLAISGIGADIPACQPTQLSLTCGDDAHAVASDVLDRVVWGTAGGGGFVNQQGVLRPIRTGNKPLRAYDGDQLVSGNAKVVGGTPVSISAKLVPDKQNPLLAKAVITLADAEGNACAARPVVVSIVGGIVDATSGVTDAKGQRTVSVTWDASATERSVKATSGTLSASAAPK